MIGAKTRTFYRRADGEAMHSGSDDLFNYEYAAENIKTPYYYSMDTADVIEEVYQLVQRRTIRVGKDEPCEVCGGNGINPASKIPETEVEIDALADYICIPCYGSGMKPRINPPYEMVAME